MVSALDSGSNDPGSIPGQATALCSWARHFTVMVPLFTKVYKIGTGEFTAGVTLRWTSIPFRGSRNTPSRFILRKPGYAPVLMGRLARTKTFYKDAARE